jgi:cytochrome P450
MVSKHILFELNLHMVFFSSEGPLVYFRIFNKKVLVLNAAKPALDLLETRAAIYSDRPIAWMMGALAGRNLSVFAIASQHPRFKMYRKVLHSGLNPRAVQDYKPILLQETRTLLNSLLQAPEDFIAHIRRYFILFTYDLYQPGTL